jgi:hypothetical protein
MSSSQRAVAALLGSQGIRGGGMLYGRYHGQILGLAIRSRADGSWKPKLREILAEFDNDCRDLSCSCNRLLRRELASQIEQEVLRFADPNKRAVLTMALKHFDSI